MARVNPVNFASQGAIQPTIQDVQRLRIADALMQRGGSDAPVVHPLQGVSRLGSGIVGGLMQRQQAEDMERRRDAYTQDMGTILSGAQAKPWVNPDTGQTSGRAGGLEGMLATADRLQSPEAKANLMQIALAQALQGPQAVKPPTIREFNEGNQVVTKQWDPSSGAWAPLSEAPRFKPDVLSPEAMAQRQRLRAAGAPRVSVGGATVQMPGETVAEAEAKDYGKSLVKDFETVQEQARNSETSLGQINMLRNIDVTTGAVEPMKSYVAGLASGLGFDPAKVGLESATNAQAFEGIAQNLVLSKMQAQKGPQTENDARRIERTIASLKNTPDAKNFLLDAAAAMEERKIEMRDFYEGWQADKRTFRGAAKAWNDFKRKTPMLGKNPTTGRPVFFNQFKRAVASSNPGATQEEILELWRNKYGRSN